MVFRKVLRALIQSVKAVKLGGKVDCLSIHQNLYVQAIQAAMRTTETGNSPSGNNTRSPEQKTSSVILLKTICFGCNV